MVVAVFDSSSHPWLCATMDDAECQLYHHGALSDGYARDAIFRVLASPSRPLPLRAPSWDSALASSQVGRQEAKRRRVTELLTTKDRMAREYLVAKRLSTDPGAGRNWAQTWARENIRIGAAAPAQKQIFCAVCDGAQNV